MNRLFLILLWVSCLPGNAAIFWAATNGLPGNAGTIGSPWDLRTALAKTAVLTGGDKLELRGGSYTNAPEHYVAGGNEGDIFQALISGSYGNEIIIESATNEWAMLDAQAFGPPFEYHATARPTLVLGSSNPANASQGRFLHLRNFEIMSTSTNARFSATVSCPSCVPPTDPSFPTDFFLGDALYVFGVSNIVENIIVHDCTTGISAWEQSSHTIIQNNVIWNNGWTGVTQLHGHGMYTQNKTPREIKDISYNVVLNNWDNSIQAYGSGSAEVEHYRIHNNIMVNNRLLVGGRVNCVQGDNQIRDNLQYNSDLVFTYFISTNAADMQVCNNYIGLGGLQGGSWTNNLMTNNYVINPTTTKLFDLNPIVSSNVPTGWIVDNNHYYYTPTNANGFRIEAAGVGPMNMTLWEFNTGFDSNSTIAINPTTNNAVLQPNQWNTNKANLAVYNWSGGTSFSTNLSVLGWSSSDSIRVRNAQDYLVDVTTNTLPGNILTVSMLAANHTVALPHGSTNVTGPMTFPKFGAFILERIVGAPPTPTNTITITSTPLSGVPVTPTVDINGNGIGNTSFTRNYLFGTGISLNAPLTFGGNNFSKWRRAGVDFATTNVVSFSVTTNETWQAVYVAPPPVTWTLNISSSNPNSGVTVTNFPPDNSSVVSGTTAYALTFNDGTIVTLAAPATASGNNFQRWDKNGSAFSVVSNITFTANSSTLVSNPSTFAAIYSPPAAPTNALAVTSSNPNAGVPITVSPADANGLSNGNTAFNRVYVTTNTVTLTAPITAPNGNVWVGWADETGTIPNTNTISTFTMAVTHSRQAVYTNAPLPDTIFMTGATNRRRGTR